MNAESECWKDILNDVFVIFHNACCYTYILSIYRQIKCPAIMIQNIKSSKIFGKGS